jgi:hypothetical protein
MLNPTGIFCNLEHVASPSVEHHLRFLHAIGYTPQMEDKSNKLLSMETQLKSLRLSEDVERKRHFGQGTSYYECVSLHYVLFVCRYIR